MESEINDTTVRNNSSDFENSDDSEGENIIAQSDYDPNSSRKIVCVELQNNQHIYHKSLYYYFWEVDMIYQNSTNYTYKIFQN